MRRLGLIGGTSWLSTIDYYRNINRLVNERLGGLEFPELLLYSVNFGDLKRNNDADDQASNARIFVDAAIRLDAAGVDALLLCANTPHLYAPQVQRATGLPLIHIADATAREAKAQGIKRLAVLGTRITMEEPFYREALAEMGIEQLIPESRTDRDWIHSTIYNELARAEFSENLRQRYLQIIGELSDRGAQGVALACTEIPLLLRPEQIPLPSIDTTETHCRAAVKYILDVEP